MKRTATICPLVTSVFLLSGCIDPIPEKDPVQEQPAPEPPLSEIAELIASLPIQSAQVEEVHDAVSSSLENGYDEEYRMTDLFRSPGSGVGDHLTRSTADFSAGYDAPLSDLIRDFLVSPRNLKSSPSSLPVFTEKEADDYLEILAGSDIQIYWPFSGESYDDGTMPVITFDPENDSGTNIGYRISEDEYGLRTVEEIVVDETYAKNNPVWVINRNTDHEHLTLEMIRKLHPELITGGGFVSTKAFPGDGYSESKGKISTSPAVKTLILKDFVMKRNYDSWFAGASEFFVKCGAVEDFSASTEAELQLYFPSVTDFMIVVKRNQVGIPQPFNAVLVSDWTDQLENCAFMIIEDDGGRRTSWKCTALVRIASKSYGIEIDLPFNTKDDIVWRGSLSSRYLEASSSLSGHFGDVDLTFEIQER